MSKLQTHIERIRRECHRIQRDGHLEHLPNGFVAVSDIEIKLRDLEEAQQQNAEGTT